MSNGKALAIVLGVVVVVGTFLALTAWLGIGQYWAGFLFLLQWSMMEETRPERLARSALGAALGTAIPFVPLWLGPVAGASVGLAAMLAIILIAVFLLIRGLVPVLVNAATMLFLTVVSIPQVAAAGPAAILLGLAAGVVFFGGLGAGAAALARGKAGEQTAALPA